MLITSIANLMSLNVGMDTACVSIALQVDCSWLSHTLQTVNIRGPEGIKEKHFASNPRMVHLILNTNAFRCPKGGGKHQLGAKEGGDSTTAIWGRCKCKGSSKRKITQTLDIYIFCMVSVHIQGQGSTVTPALFHYCRNSFLIFSLVFLVQLCCLAVRWTVWIWFIQQGLYRG